MNDKFEKAIDFLAEEIKKGVSAGDALKYSQAALNLAHAANVQKLSRETENK